MTKQTLRSALTFSAPLLLSIACSANLLAAMQPEIVIYPAPANEALSQDYRLEVNGQPVAIYLAKMAEVEDRPAWTLDPADVGGPYSFAYFDFTGEVTLKITSLNKPLDRLVIQPLSAGVAPTIEGNTATFTIYRPCKLSFEPEGRIEPLLIFAGAPEVNPPQAGDPNVIYFGPGIHKPEKIKLGSGQTLYLAGGAIVKGGVEVTGNDIQIRGRGILCGNDWAWRKGPGRMIRIADATNVTVEGIIVRGSWSWTIPIVNSRSVTITDIKLVCGKNPNDDGINPCNSQRIYIRDCFIRTDDDCIAMKGIEFGAANSNVEYITVEDCILWADRARVFLLGHESRAQYMRHIILRDLEIIHFNMTPFLFEPGEEMSIEDVIVENVTAYADHPAQGGDRAFEFIRLRPTVNQYMKNEVPGRISNIRFSNISIIGEERSGKYGIWVTGAGPQHTVSDVQFENITWHGQPLGNDSPLVRIEAHTQGIRF